MTETQNAVARKIAGKTAGNLLQLYLAKRALRILGRDLTWQETFASTMLLRYIVIQTTEAGEAANYQQRTLRLEIREALGLHD